MRGDGGRRRGRSPGRLAQAGRCAAIMPARDEPQRCQHRDQRRQRTKGRTWFHRATRFGAMTRHTLRSASDRRRNRPTDAPSRGTKPAASVQRGVGRDVRSRGSPPFLEPEVLERLCRAPVQARRMLSSPRRTARSPCATHAAARWLADESWSKLDSAAANSSSASSRRSWSRSERPSTSWALPISSRKSTRPPRSSSAWRACSSASSARRCGDAPARARRPPGRRRRRCRRRGGRERVLQVARSPPRACRAGS